MAKEKSPKERTCCWPMWPDGAKPNGRYCGKPSDSNYCPLHRQISRVGSGNGPGGQKWVEPYKPSGIRIQRGVGVGKVE